MRGTLLFLWIVSVAHAADAKDIPSLGGYALGDDQSLFLNKLGKPERVEKKEDAKANIYFSKDKTTYLLFLVSKKGEIQRIQVTGPHPFDNEDLNGLKLGDPESKMVEILGKPSESKYQDERWGSSHYYEDDNYSLETNKGKVTSIYINFSEQFLVRSSIEEVFKEPKYKSKDEKISFLLVAAQKFKDRRKCVVAAELYNMVLAEDLNNMAAIVNQGNCFRDVGRTAKAKELYLRAMKVEPNNQTLIYNLGLAASDLGEKDEAPKYYKTAIQIWKRNSKLEGSEELAARAYTQVGNILDDDGKFQEALEQYEQALKIKKDFPLTLYNMAVAYERAKRFEKAKDLLKKVIRLEPTNEEAKEMLKRIEGVKKDSRLKETKF